MSIPVGIYGIDKFGMTAMFDFHALVAMSHDHEGAGTMIEFGIDVFFCEDVHFTVFVMPY